MQMIDTKAFQILDVKVAQELLLRGLLCKHPVIELESKVFCAEIALELLFLGAIVQHFFWREIAQELFYIILCTLTSKELTSRNI